MPKKKILPDTDDVIEKRIRRFDKGQDKKAPNDLDGDMEEFGDFGGQDVVPRPVADTDTGPEPAEESLVPRNVLRVEISGTEAEFVCGQIPSAARERVETFCRRRGVAVREIWYGDDERMRQLAGPEWTAWYDVDEFFHGSGLVGRSAESFGLAISFEGETVEDAGTARFKTTRLPAGPPPKPAPGRVAVSAGMVQEGRCAFELDIDGEFEPDKLEFVLLDLSPFGLDEPLLMEIRYDGEPMVDAETEPVDVFDVKFL